MNTQSKRRFVLASFVMLALLSGRAPAQTTLPPDTANNPPKDEEVVVLSPFVVQSDRDNGYEAKETLAGTRVRTELKDVASALSVVTKQFLDDTGVKNSQDLLVYTTNTEVGGLWGNFSGAGGSQTYSEAGNLLHPSNNTRVRGLDSADNTRDYFLTEIPWDGYIVDRVDIQRGPNSILFGVGSPAGIINSSVNGAMFRNANKVENRISSYGSLRTSFDVNYVALKNELGFRVAALDDLTHYRQDPAFNHDKRIYAALRFDPQLLKDGHTSVRMNFEDGRVNANRPRTLPPIDGLSSWFLTGTANGVANPNKLTLNPLTTWNQYSTYAWFHESFMGRLMSSNIANYYDATTSTLLYSQMPNIGTPQGLDSTGVVDGTIGGIEFARPWALATYNNYARTAIPGGSYYSNVSISDPSIYNFYDKLIDGDNKREWQNWRASNLALSQTFFDDRLGFEFVYDYQRYNDGQFAFLNGDQYIVGVDINTNLIDGSVNPNLGRPYVANSGQYGNQENHVGHDSYRFTLTGEFRSEDIFGKSWLSGLLGRHVFTGLASQDTKTTDYRTFSRWASSPAFTDALGIGADNASSDITNGTRQIDWIAYLGPSLLNANSAAGANLSNVTTVINPTGTQTTRYFDSHWNAPTVDPAAAYTYVTHDASGNLVSNTGTQADNPANYVGWKSGTFPILNAENSADLPSLYASGTKGKNRIRSKGITWQGYFLEGDVVPVFGWRRDEITDTKNQAAKGTYNEALQNYTYDTGGLGAATNSAAGESKSWGVVLHTPRKWSDRLPGATNLSLFFNRSQNFKADAPRGDIFGNTIPNQSGRTKDYGFAVSTLHDRVSFKINWYETDVKNASLQADSAGFSGSLYYVWALPYWGATHALAALDGIASPQRNQGDWGWPWNNIATLPDGTPDTNRIRAIVTDFFTKFPLDQHFADEYGLGLDVAKMHSTSESDWYAAVPQYAGAANLGLQPAYNGALKSFGTGPVASVDTTSKGIEFELTANPTKLWNITFNASKTNATRTDLSPSIDAWIATYSEFLAGDAGLITLWGGDPIRKVWADNVVAPYQVLKNQQGSSAPEVPQWRFNLVSSYTFGEGPVKGFNVGGAYRWEDKRILGYQYSPTLATLDISKPWYGPSDDHIDLWVGYGRKLTEKLHWRVQLNLRNVGESSRLVPVTMQPDGSVALARIQDGMGWQLTNTFTF